MENNIVLDIFRYTIMYIAINQLIILLVDKLTRFMKMDDIRFFHPTMNWQLYVFITLTGVLSLLLIVPIRKYRKRVYDMHLYQHKKFQRMAFPSMYKHDDDPEFTRLDRIYKLKQIKKSQKKWHKIF